LNIKPPESFATNRLLLRVPRLSDAETIFSLYAQDSEVTRYLTWKPHADLDTTRVMLQGCQASWESESSFPWVITWKANEQLVGMISMRIKGFEAILGYVLARPFWKQGIMPEAVAILVDWALNQSSIYRVWAVCDYENLASARVMEKVGMVREGLMRRGVLHPNMSDEPRDCWLYAKVK
jgi:[ribosomal protein S5]-alanine N-acetyltransferase